ncbi:MAG: hypothetical protein Q8R26_00100 [bacterium]|nr:hypothetical protein [bacterium]
MWGMKKITISKSDEISVVVEKMIDINDQDIVLVIPRFSHVGESLSNFHLLKREAVALEKNIVIESVDDHVVELAEMTGLKAVNPFFARNKRQFSDIVAPKSSHRRDVKKPVIHIIEPDRSKGSKKNTVEDRFAELESDIEQSMINRTKHLFDTAMPHIAMPKLSFRLPSFSKNFFVWIFIVGLFGVAVYGAVTVLPRARVIIISQTQEWIYNDVLITKTGAVIDSATMTIPNQVFSQQKTGELRFPATGRRQIEKKATGVMTIYNSYSSDPQPLVGETRFMAPDGKIYRLVKSIVVPGAKIVEGKIIPSSIDTDVSADKAGPDYNTGPVKLFTIPGFKGSPKYQAFYGESKGSMEGGFIGEVAYPTDKDIDAAKKEAQKTFEEEARATLLAQIDDDFRILDGAMTSAVKKQSVADTVDQQGSFGIISEVSVSVIAFREDDVRSALAARAQKELKDGEAYVVRKSTLEYALARADFAKGLLTFPVTFNAELVYVINVDGLRSKILGKPEVEYRTIVLSTPGLKTATVSLWPFWVKTVPASLDKVKIEVE